MVILGDFVKYVKCKKQRLSKAAREAPIYLLMRRHWSLLLQTVFDKVLSLIFSRFANASEENQVAICNNNDIKL